MGYVIPQKENVVTLLGPFFGDDYAVEAIEDSEAPEDYVAIFIDPEDKPVAVGLCDAAFAAYSGAAFSMIPKGVADDFISEGEFSGMIADNLRELMNICSRLLMSDRSSHLRLDSVVPRADATCMEALEQSGKRVAFEVTVPRYGSGKLAFLTT